MAIAIPSASSLRPAATGRGVLTLTALLAAFVAVPWLVRPLEALLPPAEVARIGYIAETVLGVVLGLWVFRLMRHQHRLSIEHAHEIERLTESDALTGLGNRRALSRELELVLNRARRTREPVAVLYFDIDASDDVNRRHGRGAGDPTLRMMGAVLRSSVRFGVDAGYRIAEDEFAIVLAAGRDAALNVGRRLEWNFQERTPRKSNLSVGVATWDGRKGPDGLLEEARRAVVAQRQTAMVAQMA
jgi:diguanylate cyclase (GGDEF)-like protein